ncbi:molybdate ABC transporter substrate-binding protein [Lacisediminimonas sp.]|uniref:molybdate ABC transporter substrate-binding protein n=1 Tax=Lacisediminimonas sp. TaxID=3060582 RepID=UPI002727C27B|nr:molybdate ABC transporter substrate-binding protein [Lacisediminimonas sp.]MDO8300363.1 molybdate ABC transporter substrate-binding protein [Lacisediminimonas sp.]
MPSSRSRPPSPTRRRLLAGAVVTALLPSLASATNAPPLIAAASDLKFALDEIAAAYLAASGNAVRCVYGSSGNFRRQIAQGAPFELFFSADESYVDALSKEKRTVDGGMLYASGRIAIMVPPHSPLKPQADLGDLRAALGKGEIKRLAIANPDHAPYGRAARQALENTGLWPLLAGKLVLGENVSQAAQFATSGSTDGGIIAYSLALAPAIGKLGRHALIPASLHAPLRQKMVLIAGAGATARDFYRFVQSPQARAILSRNGFSGAA